MAEFIQQKSGISEHASKACIQQKSEILRNQKISGTTNVVSEHASFVCIFCKIVKGEIPCSKLYEDDKTFAFLDIAPINKGHALVIPKEHYETFEELPDGLLKYLVGIVRKVSKAVKKGTKADGYNIGMNIGKAAGQLVFHAHFHIMPRFNDDGLKTWPQGRYEDGEMDKFREQIVKFL